MKIRRKISIIFTILASLVLLCSFSFVYYFSYRDTKKEFFIRLESKADFIAKKYYEQDELSKKIYQEIIEENIKTLPEATDITLNTNNPTLVRDSLRGILSQENISQLLSGQNIQFSLGEQQGVGIYYPDNQGTFIIIVMATDKNGIKELHNLLKVFIDIFICSIAFIYFLGMFYSRKVLSPIGEILKNVKKIRATSLSLRLPENNGKDELGELTQTLNQMLERLEHSFNMQKNFIHNASHELKNPLTAILGETEITLLKKRSQEEYVETLNKVFTEAERLNLLTRNLLNLAQADFEIAEMNTEKIRLDELLWDIKGYFDKTEYKDLLLFYIPSLPKNTDNLTIVGISNLLKIAISNLIDNACKFSDHQIVDIVLSVNKENLKLTISDKGIGIPENEINNLFQPFFRASNTHNYKGSGVGLSLADKIIKLHGGSMTFHSFIGKGTRVEICFNITPISA
jgi:signal transduction histidine kinase